MLHHGLVDESVSTHNRQLPVSVFARTNLYEATKSLMFTVYLQMKKSISFCKLEMVIYHKFIVIMIM